MTSSDYLFLHKLYTSKSDQILGIIAESEVALEVKEGTIFIFLSFRNCLFYSLQSLTN